WSSSSQVLQPTSPIQRSLVPGLRVNRNGLRSPSATMRLAFASLLAARGLSGSPAPVAGLTRSTAPLRSAGPATRCRLRARRAPPSAVGGVWAPPTGAGGSPHGFFGARGSPLVPPYWP